MLHMTRLAPAAASCAAGRRHPVMAIHADSPVAFSARSRAETLGRLPSPMCGPSRPLLAPIAATPDAENSAISSSANGAAPSSPLPPPALNGGGSLVGLDQPNPLEGARLNPSEAVRKLWASAEAVCFDVDCTVTINDSLDLLAEFMGVKDEVEALTNQAMDGSMDLKTALEKRLDIINCTPADIKGFLKAYPPKTRLAPGIEELIKTLKGRGVAVFLISGGFRELILPVAAHLGIPRENVMANRMNWQWDDETGMPTRLVGFDLSEPTAHNQGKPQAIADIRQRYPYRNIVMIGDGITDLEAVQATGGADLFIGYGGVIVRESVASAADWFVESHLTLLSSLKKFKVAMIGSGAWACAAARMVAQSVKADDPAHEFDTEVRMWVYEEQVEGRKLTELINERHENPKYLPGVELGENVMAVPTIDEAVDGADCIIICAPHQFLYNICKQMSGKVKKDAMAISLTKGMRVRSDGPQLISQMVQRYLGVDCAVLMGGNVASEIAAEQPSEAVIGYSNLEHAKVWQKLFTRPYFRTTLLPDTVGAEMCGTLKNIVALGAGVVDGLGYGPNSKATVLRQGLAEMRGISKDLYPSVRDDTFFEACGLGDLVATCYGGRNRLVAEEWTKRHMAGQPSTFDQLEKEMLGGQKLQGVLTSEEVQEILRLRGWELRYPLFTTINRIIKGHLPPSYILKFEEGARFVIPTGDDQTDPEEVAPVRPKKKAVVNTTVSVAAHA